MKDQECSLRRKFLCRKPLASQNGSHLVPEPRDRDPDQSEGQLPVRHDPGAAHGINALPLREGDLGLCPRIVSLPGRFHAPRVVQRHDFCAGLKLGGARPPRATLPAPPNDSPAHERHRGCQTSSRFQQGCGHQTRSQPCIECCHLGCSLLCRDG